MRALLDVLIVPFYSAASMLGARHRSLEQLATTRNNSPRQRYGRIVNLSSEMGALTHMGGGYLAYRMSKASLNVVTRVLADETSGSGVLINAMHPGWVRTSMGGTGAHRSVEQGADTAVWLATLPDDGPTGGFYRERKPIDW